MLLTNLLHGTLDGHFSEQILHCVSLLIRPIVSLTLKRSVNYFKYWRESYGSYYLQAIAYCCNLLQLVKWLEICTDFGPWISPKIVSKKQKFIFLDNYFSSVESVETSQNLSYLLLHIKPVIKVSFSEFGDDIGRNEIKITILFINAA